MATYSELHSLLGNVDLTQKIQMAAAESARVVAMDEDTAAPFDQTAGKHDLRMQWAADVMADTGRAAQQILPLVLMANKGSDLATILAATDSAIQGNVDEMVDALASKFA